MEAKLILHRGYKGKYLENGKEGFEHALQEGKDFETDIRVSKDGQCFLIHDETLDRLLNGSGKIQELTAEQLKQFSYKDGSKLVSLEEFCNLIENNEENSLIFIHIKEIKDIDAVIKVLNEFDFQNRVRFFACDELTLDFVRLIKEKYSDYQVGLHFYEDSGFGEEEFKKADFIWADEITKKNISKEKVELAHKLQKPFYAISPELIPESIFNANIEGRWKELLEVGVEGICTDKPEEFKNFK